MDVTDYLDFIVDTEYGDAVYSAFADYFVENRDKFDVLDLCNIPQDSVTLKLLPDLLKEKGLETSVEQQEVCRLLNYLMIGLVILVNWTKNNVMKSVGNYVVYMAHKLRLIGILLTGNMILMPKLRVLCTLWRRVTLKKQNFAR